jgi:hypothetical protein
MTCTLCECVRYGRTALHVAVEYDSTQIADALLRGVGPTASASLLSATDGRRRTPLATAALFKRTRAVSECVRWCDIARAPDNLAQLQMLLGVSVAEIHVATLSGATPVLLAATRVPRA